MGKFENGAEAGAMQGIHEPIAIIGMGCLFPGGVSSPSQLWDLLQTGKSGHSAIPASRFNSDGFYHPDRDRPGSINATGGYFIDGDLRSFENSFFGINNLEATYMDPQQRKLLEVVYECFESAGYPLHKVSGANVGCYVASFTTDFFGMQFKDPDEMHRYSATGMGTTILGNRISHVFNLQGPSFTLDTACSSSLYALHLACAGLDAGECDSAVVAGANLILSPEIHLGAVKAGILSDTSTCHSFDSSADGYGRAEGVGAVYLKRLSDAIRDGDPVRSVIRGTAINSNGRTNGITLPSADGQEAVIRKAYAKAGLPTNETDYVESHTTGTPVGDPIEVDAISRVLHHKSGRETLIGTVKSNLGHSEAVSGLCSLIKVTLALEHGLIPPTIGIKDLNPDLKLKERNVKVVTALTKWPSTERKRAGVNSFGYGGANAHAILESAESHVPPGYRSHRPGTALAKKFILPFSANSESSLVSRVADLHTANLQDIDILDLEYTLTQRRSILPVRGFLLAKKETLANDLVPSNLRKSLRTTSTGPKLPLAFVFTGQGAQTPQMGYELIQQFPTYRNVIDALDTHLETLRYAPTWKIRDSILESTETSEINTALHSQTVCTATQIALITLLKEWNVSPTAVIGHSSGEIAAAFAAGFIDAKEAITIAYYRGFTVSKSTMKGAMMAVGLDRKSASREISRLEISDRARIACVNSPESVTMSGDSEAIDSLLGELQGRGVFARKLKTDNTAYHSHHMEIVGREYQELLSNAEILKMQQRSATFIQMISSVTGKLVDVAAVRSFTYWRTNLESPVLFQDAMETLLRDQKYHMVEIGPHPALELPVKQISANLQIDKDQIEYSGTLSRGKDSVDCMLNLVGTLYLHGHEVAFKEVNAVKLIADSIAAGRVIHDLPNYRWDYGPLLYHEPRMSLEFRNRKYPRHDILGSKVLGGSGEVHFWKNTLNIKDISWLEDHKLNGEAVFPGAGYLAMAVEALRQVQLEHFAQSRTLKLRQIRFLNVLNLSQSEQIEIFTQLKQVPLSSTAASTTWWQFEISSYGKDVSTMHANGLISLGHSGSSIKPNINFSAKELLKQKSNEPWYRKFSDDGLGFGPAFQSMTAISSLKSDVQACAAEVTLHAKLDPRSPYVVHPITLDALLQAVIIASAAGNVENLTAKVPFSIGEIQIANSAMTFDGMGQVYATSEVVSFGTVNGNAELSAMDGRLVIQMHDFRAVANQRRLGQEPTADERNPMLQVVWRPEFSNFSPGENYAFTDYLNRFGVSWPGESIDADCIGLCGALDLLAHSDPSCNILELGDLANDLSELFLKVLGADTKLKRFGSYTQGSIKSDGKLELPNIQYCVFNQIHKTENERSFDIVFLPKFEHRFSVLQNKLKELAQHLGPGAKILLTTTSGNIGQLCSSGFSVIHTRLSKSGTATIVAQNHPQSNGKHNKQSNEVILIERERLGFGDILAPKLLTMFGHVRLVALQDVSPTTVPPGSIVVNLSETSKPLLADISPTDLQSIKFITDAASTVLWITGGGLFKARRPEYALVLGLARAVMLEQPTTKFFVLDVDDTNATLNSTTDQVLWILSQAKESQPQQFEYMSYEGALHTSRFEDNSFLNRNFQSRQNLETVTTTLSEAGDCSLSIKYPGITESLYFSQSAPKAFLDPNSVEVETRCVGLNAKDVLVLGGKVDTKDATCALEFTGVVSRVGSAVEDFVIGDRVVVMAPNKFSTREIVPDWACYKLSDDEDFQSLSTVPIVFSTAIHALQNLARLQNGESVLIHGAAGGVGIAAIQIAQLASAAIFVTVGSEAKKRYLMDAFGLESDHIFDSRASSFVPAIKALTHGRGVDVVLNSLTKDQLHDSWSIMAEFGRFVEIGKRDIVDAGKLDMGVFKRCVTFTAFDLSYFYNSDLERHQRAWQRLLQQSITLLREGKIQAVKPLHTIDVSQIDQAYRQLSLRTRMGKIAVSLENRQSPINVLPKKYGSSFSSDKDYLMIGCLGGIGRSVTKWMFSRGARRFTFLNRSGAGQLSSTQLLNDLRGAGAVVNTVKGDVSVFSDVERAVAGINSPIGGIVHAAMGLQEMLWSSMTSDAWHKSLDPKVKGTWNLHKALQGRDSELEFFLLLSSITGSLGTATEANYCAANSFQDAFARYRRSLGLPATALGLGMIAEVGYLHENPEIEKLLKRKGIQAINETELLQICDFALSGQRRKSWPGSEHFAESHILTGLETQGMVKLRQQGFDGTHHILNDPRAKIIANALAVEMKKATQSAASEPKDSSHQLAAVAACLKPGGTLCATPTDPALLEAIQAVVIEKMLNLLLLSPDQLTPHIPLGTFGMDSMLAADGRHFVFRTFQVDIPFLTLLAPSTTVASLAEIIGIQLWSREGENEKGA